MKLRFIKDLGRKYPTSKSKQKARYWIVECPNCFKQYEVMANNANRNHSTKCRSCSISEIKTSHGLSNHLLMRTYGHIKTRCYNENSNDFIDYGKRGIIMCDEWKYSFISFYNWAIANGHEKGLSIDRIDNDGNYEPSNCRWVTQEIQSRNCRVIRKTNTSGFKGVYKKINRYVAKICVSNKQIYIGSFLKIEDAAVAYDNYILENNLEHTRNFK